jgi:16S rRNA (adenine1518-N6/adenine1519-N6)-dimethyltransferase
VQTLAEIKELLDAHGLRPKRSLGQNFLVDHNLIRKLVDASGVKSGDLVLEVGPGTGTMTEELLARGCEVIACELDDGLAALLAERIPGVPGGGAGGRFTLIHRDCLEGKHTLAPEIVTALRGRPFSLVANLPYGAGTPLMMTLLLDHPACRLMAVTIQREVADRLLADPGTKDYGSLGIIAQIFAHVERIAKAPPECFWPRPDVSSSMVLLRRRADPITRDGAGLSDVLRNLFAQRRKQLGGLLGPGIDWPAIAAAPGCQGLVPALRAEQLAPTQIVALARALGRIRD